MVYFPPKELFKCGRGAMLLVFPRLKLKPYEPNRQVSFAGHRSQVTGHRSQVTGQYKKAISITGDVRITQDSQAIYRYFHVTNVSPYNFHEKFQTSQYFKLMYLFKKEHKSDTVTVINFKITFMGENWHFPWLVFGMPLFK